MNINPSIESSRKRIEETFQKHFGGTTGLTVAMAPGRVNLIGEHTDYNDGFVLPMTIDRAVYIGLRPRNDNLCKMYSVNYDEQSEWSLDDISKSERQPWTDFLKGVQQQLLAAGYELKGVEGVVYGDVPLGSGLSSSAAIEVAMAFALQNAFQFDMNPVDMATLCQRAENEFVGLQCGIMDQFVSRLGKRNQALFLDCRTLQYEHIPFSFDEVALLIVDTRKKRELAKSAYNERRAECAEAVAFFRSINSQVTALRDVSPEEFEKHKELLSGKVRGRVRHVVTENRRVLDAVAALKGNDISFFGNLMYASHRSLREDYNVSCEELDWIVDKARDNGALGARLTGAGFGGCALVLTSKDRTEPIIEKVGHGYRERFGVDAAIMTLRENFEAGIM